MKHKIVLIIGIVLLIIFIVMSVFTTTSKYSIIKNYKENEELFKRSVEELSTIEELYISLDGDIINIHTYQDTEDTKNKMIRIPNEDFYKYEQTINLMKKLKIKKIDSLKGNISFLFTTSFYPGGKEIAYIANLEDYVRTGHKVREKQQISGNWYYVVNESL